MPPIVLRERFGKTDVGSEVRPTFLLDEPPESNSREGTDGLRPESPLGADGESAVPPLDGPVGTSCGADGVRRDPGITLRRGPPVVSLGCERSG